jgi:NAD(P)-dependent dehydrogenase (short-subunit alcohol dehydrogenase family)
MATSDLIFITGSSDGLGLLAAQQLIAQGHRVHLHAKNEDRKKDLEKRITGYQSIQVADFSVVEEVKQLARVLISVGPFDTMIHNAGVYNASAESLFKVNVLAPYWLSVLTPLPRRHIYVSSDMHLGGSPRLDELTHGRMTLTYSDSKLLLLLLAKAFARRWPTVKINALHPGWVPTKMGGANAPDDLQKGVETQVWLATSNDPLASGSGQYFFHKKLRRYHEAADMVAIQDRLIEICSTFND